MKENFNDLFKTNLNLTTKEEFENYLKQELEREGFVRIIFRKKF